MAVDACSYSKIQRPHDFPCLISGCSIFRVLLHLLYDFATLPEFAHHRETRQSLGLHQLSQAKDLRKKQQFTRAVDPKSVNYHKRPLISCCETFNNLEIY